jgi:LCP family protein required for cell wall assembly
MLRTLKELTGVVPDFPVLVNFEAVREITDAVGGVDVTGPETTQDYRTLEIFEAGRQHLNGERADAYVRQRKAICSDIFPVTNPRRKGAECGLPRGDYDRQARQQQYLAALSHRIDEKGITNKPGKLDQLLRVITKNLTVDENMPVQDLVFSLKTLGQEDLTFLSLPMLGSQTLDSGAIVEAVDEEQTDALFTAMKNGTLPEYVATYGANDTTEGA